MRFYIKIGEGYMCMDSNRNKDFEIVEILFIYINRNEDFLKS